MKILCQTCGLQFEAEPKVIKVWPDDDYKEKYPDECPNCLMDKDLENVPN